MPAALLVIDMQVGSFGQDAKRHDVPAKNIFCLYGAHGLAARITSEDASAK